MLPPWDQFGLKKIQSVQQPSPGVRKRYSTEITPSSTTLSQPPFPLSPPPPILHFNFDVNTAVTEIMNGLETGVRSQELNEYEAGKLSSPLYCNTTSSERCFESELQPTGTVSVTVVPPDSSTAAETDAYLAICQSLQPIAQIS